MKNILTILAIITSLFLINSTAFAKSHHALKQKMPVGDFSNLSNTGASIVTEVVNPLTLKLKDGRLIHLAGLDFPDLNFYEYGDLSVTAQKILEDFLIGKKVIIYQTISKDKGRKNRMGHYIAHLVRADKKAWVQGLLLSLGIARVRTTQYNPEMASQMLALEKTARANKFGLWNMDEHKILTPEQAKQNIGSYQIVEGRIHNASMRKNKLYLNFGKNWRKDFTVAISAFNLKKFLKKKINPRQWNGKTIRVRGWIKSYNGPYMEIKYPERFEAIFEEQETSNDKNAKNALPNKSHSKSKEHKPRKKDKGSALPILND